MPIALFVFYNKVFFSLCYQLLQLLFYLAFFSRYCSSCFVIVKRKRLFSIFVFVLFFWPKAFYRRSEEGIVGSLWPLVWLKMLFSLLKTAKIQIRDNFSNSMLTIIAHWRQNFLFVFPFSRITREKTSIFFDNFLFTII